MTVSLSFLDDTWRVRLALSGFPDGAVHVERSINGLFWRPVRGGDPLELAAGGAAVLDDWEYQEGVSNTYRVRQATWEDMVQIFTSSGTWTKPVGLVAVRVTVLGGGGGGGGCATTSAGQNAIGGAGASGVTSMSWIPATDLGATETVTVGAAGTGGTAGANSGSAGGTSTFTRTTGTNVSAAGGTAGTGGLALPTPAAAQGTVGSTTGTGDLVIPGRSTSPRFYAVNGATVSPGGADSMFGAGGFGNGGSGGSDGANAVGRGAGGAGARNSQSQGTARAGGPGTAGLVLVEHFFDEIGV